MILKSQKSEGFFRKPKKADNDNDNDNVNDTDTDNDTDNDNESFGRFGEGGGTERQQIFWLNIFPFCVIIKI